MNANRISLDSNLFGYTLYRFVSKGDIPLGRVPAILHQSSGTQMLMRRVIRFNA